MGTSSGIQDARLGEEIGLKPISSVSVVIPSCNSSKTLGMTLRSVIEQGLGRINEIIVVDSSDDGSLPSIAAEFEPLGVRFIISGVRVMPAIQRNIGARESTGDLIVFLDSDIELLPGYFDRIVDYYRRGYKAGFGAVDVPEHQKGSPIALAQYYLQLNEFLPSGATRIKAFFVGCNNFCDRALFEEVGGYPEIRAAEDTLLGIRISELTPIVFIPQAVVAHVFREDRDSFARNQELLGRYVSKYRRESTGSFLYKRPAAFLLSPAFFLAKLLRMSVRIAMSGPRQMGRYLRVLPLTIRGLRYWMKGFLSEAATDLAPGGKRWKR